MAVSDGETITVTKDMGLVSNVFDDRMLAALDGHLAIGHTRYSTTGSSTWRNAQPFYRDVGDHAFALGAQRQPREHGRSRGARPACCPARSRATAISWPSCWPRSSARSRSRAATVGRSSARCVEVLPTSRRRLLVRVDGRRSRRSACGTPAGSGRWCSASSTTVGCSRPRRRPSTSSAPHFVRELQPGEMVVIDATGARSVWPFEGKVPVDPKLCLFEFVYFSRPDGRLYGQNVHAARVRMGEELAEQAPVEADLVMGVPESGIPAAEGFARGSGTPARPGPGEEPLHRPYVHRTQPGAARAGRAHEAEPAAREHCRQTVGGRRRLDRARHHHAGHGADVARGRRDRDPHAGVVASVQVAVLLRHGHRSARRAARPPTSTSARSRTT